MKKPNVAGHFAAPYILFYYRYWFDLILSFFCSSNLYYYVFKSSISGGNQENHIAQKNIWLQTTGEDERTGIMLANNFELSGWKIKRC